jgi:hypothetical protein
LYAAIKRGSSIYDENEWLWFIYSVISTCGNGMHLGGSALPDHIDKEENYKKMAKFIGDKICRTT